MTRARELAKLANPEVFSVDSINNVGVNSSTPDAKLDVVGVVSATQYFGDGSNLTGIVAGATLNASSGIQRLVVTSQTSGSMTQAATNADIAYNTSTNTLSATNFSGTLLGNATGLQGTPSITVQDVAAEKVSIAGTISYEDVTNVNSVGIITANKGIRVPNYGMTVTGVVTATSYQGDGSSLTGVESGVSNFVASGNIANGTAVVIKTDGTVGIVTSTGSATPSVGTPVVFNAGNSTPDVVFDSTNNKVVVVYTDDGNSGHGTAIVGTVSGTSISFGSEVVFNAGNTATPKVAFVGSSKVVVVYRDSGNNQYGTAVVGTISGTSISFGSENAHTSHSGSYNAIAYDSANDKVVIVYKNESNNKAYSKVGTVSGTSISFGSPTEFNDNTYYTSLTYVGSGKVVVFYRDSSNSGYGSARVGTVSGTSISFGSEVVFENSTLSRMSSTFDSTNNKVVIAYVDGGDSDKGKVAVGTVSGTSISFGTPVIFNNASTSYPGITFDSNENKVVIVYRDGDNSNYGTLIQGTVSGTNISFGSEVVYESAVTSWNRATYDSHNDKTVIVYADSGNSSYGTAAVFSSSSLVTNLTSENYIGIAAEAISNGATGKITTIGGINSGQTGLTTAQTYYVQTDGSLGTSAGNPSVVAGTAVSNTKVLVWKS